MSYDEEAARIAAEYDAFLRAKEGPLWGGVPDYRDHRRVGMGRRVTP